MNTGQTFLRVLAMTLITASTQVLADSPPDMRNNPFSRPPTLINGGDDVFVVSETNGRPGLDLQATMVGSQQRLANVAGRILRIGDEIEGFTLVRVYEDRAVFERAGDAVTVYVRATPETDDE